MTEASKALPQEQPLPDTAAGQESCTVELEEANLRAERRYRAFLDFLPDPVFVFNLDGTVSYLNPAFERVFGWTLAELEGRRIPFVPEDEKQKTRQGIERLFAEKVLHSFETRRLTKDGRVLDMLIDGAIFFDEDNRPAGQVITLRDITREKKVERINQTLFRVVQALHQYRQLDQLLEYITRQVQLLIDVDGASVILLDEQRQEFYFPVAAYENSETGRRMREIRFPADKGVAGHVYRTGLPLIVPDTSQSPYFFSQVDEQSDYRTLNMLDVPLRVKERMIGVLCAVNKKNGRFDPEDVDLLSAIAGVVALPIENARIDEQLQRSYKDVQRLNRAKDRVIHHLSHELKTPVSVLDASLELLRKRLGSFKDRSLARILDRSQRNLARLLDMQYQIEDLLRERDYAVHGLLSTLLDSCSDEIEALVEGRKDGEEGLAAIRRTIDTLFGPKEAVCQAIDLASFVKTQMERLAPKFKHRHLKLTIHTSRAPSIWIPPEVLTKILEGLVRNAIENTPDGSAIHISVKKEKEGALLEVRDYGVGMSPEKLQLIQEQYFVPYDPLHYSSRQPFDFDAGGKGFDLIRMTIFSERYHFKLNLHSTPCAYLSETNSSCPGKIRACDRAGGDQACRDSGGTLVTLRFLPLEQARDLMHKDPNSSRTKPPTRDDSTKRSDSHAKQTR